MFKDIVTYIKEGSLYAALEVSEIDGVLYLFLLKVRKSKGELSILSSEKIEDWKFLKNKIGNQTPLFLIINTAQVVAKKVLNTNDRTPEVLHKAYPNLEVNLFFYQIHVASSYSWVAIAKKQDVNHILERLKAQHITPFGIALGFSSADYFSNYLDDTVMYISNAKIEFREKSINEATRITIPVDTSYTIKGLKIKNDYILGFSTIVGYLNGKSSIVNYQSTLNKFHKSLTDRRLWNLGLKGLIPLFLGILIINFIVFDHYFEKVQQVKVLLEVNAKEREDLQKLQKEVSNKAERVTILNGMANSKATYYLDEIAQTIPERIVLNEISYQPLSKPIQPLKPMLVSRNELYVSGKSGDGNEFSNWIIALEKKPWISYVETQDYDFVSSKSSQFSLKITIDDAQH